MREKKVISYINLGLNRFDVKMKRKRLFSSPFDVILEITTYCNLKCPMCEHSFWDRKCKHINKNMSFDEFRTIFDKLKGVYSIHFGGLGENLLNPDFINMLAYAKKKGFFVGFVSNFTLIDENKAKAILNTGVDHVLVSFDAHDKKTYDKIRVNGNFDVFIKNVKNFIKTRDAGNYKTSVTGNVVMNGYNQDYLQQIVDKAKDVGIGDLSMDVMVEFGQCASKMKPRVDSIKRTVERLKKDNPDTILKFGFWDKFKITDCKAPWLSIVITYDGFVLPCCFAENRGSREKTLKYAAMGNLLSQNLKDIWNSDRYIQMRKMMTNGQIPLQCRGCGMIENGIMHYD